MLRSAVHLSRVSASTGWSAMQTMRRVETGDDDDDPYSPSHGGLVRIRTARDFSSFAPSAARRHFSSFAPPTEGRPPQDASQKKVVALPGAAL